MDLKDLERVRREHFSSTGLLSLGAAIRTPIPNPRGAVPIEVIRQEGAAIRKLGLPMTMHARPGIVSVLAAHDLLGKDLQLVHPQGVSAHECGLLADHGTSMSCSPVIEMHYAQATRGVIQYQELDERNIQQSLSVDSSAASANADFFSCMRALLWSHTQRFGSAQPLPAHRLLQLATLEGARDLGRAGQLLVRKTDPNMAPVFDAAHALVYSGQPNNVETVIVDGQALIRNGAFTSLDIDQVVRQFTHQQAGGGLGQMQLARRRGKARAAHDLDKGAQLPQGDIRREGSELGRHASAALSTCREIDQWRADRAWWDAL